MALSTDNTYITNLIGVGSDAMKNLYLVEFSGGVFSDSEGTSTSFKVRNQDFTPPTFTQAKDPKNFLTVSVDVPAPGISGEKEFSLTIRLDSQYQVYAKLARQQALTMVGNSGWATNEVPDSDNDSGFTVTVKAYQKNSSYTADDEESYITLYEFRHCWIGSLDPLSYTYDSNSPLSMRATVRFMDFDDPMDNLL